MKQYLRWIALILLVIAVWNLNLRPHVINLDEEVDVRDPAIEAMTGSHSDAWGGIDRWAYPGLESWRVQKRLKQQGFSCTQPQDMAVGGEPRSGTHTMICSQTKSWPLTRQQTLELRINYDLPGGGRLQAAQARSTVKAASWREQFAKLLRRLHALEPESLQIRGLQAQNTDELARIIADTLLQGRWLDACMDALNKSCKTVLATRKSEGFAALPAGAWMVGSSKDMLRQLNDIGFASSSQIVDEHDAFMAARVEGEQLWLDLQRQDLAGQNEKIALGINPVGATPVRLRIEGASAAREFLLQGRASTSNSDYPKWLFPLMSGALVQSGDELATVDTRKALWLYPQTMDETGDNLQRFSRHLAFIDPAFQGQLLLAYIDLMLQEVATAPESALGLQPPLQTADRMATALARSGVARLLPADAAETLIRQHYAAEDKIVARAAWALYRCEKSSGLAEIDPVCWSNFRQTDSAASRLLQASLQEQMQNYAALDAGNPVQRRLQGLASIYAQTGSPP